MPNPERIFTTLFAYQQTAALKAAIELGVFTAIAGGASTTAEIAAKCGASERGTRILCDTLVTHEFLTKDGDKYANSPESSFFLSTNSPAYLGSIAEFLCTPELVSSTMALAECVRKGGTTMPGQGTVDPDNPMWVRFAEAMAPMIMPSAQAIAAQVPVTGDLKVLDIAAGHGIFGILIAQKNPTAQIVALDWSAVLEVAKKNAAKFGVADRYSTLPGDAFSVDYGSGYDIILVTNFLHHFSAAANEGFLRNVNAALKPGGTVMTVEFVPDESRVTPAMPARFAMTMLTGTKEGDAYTFKELDSMFRNAGFAHSTQQILPTGQSVIISTK